MHTSFEPDAPFKLSLLLLLASLRCSQAFQSLLLASRGGSGTEVGPNTVLLFIFCQTNPWSGLGSPASHAHSVRPVVTAAQHHEHHKHLRPPLALSTSDDASVTRTAQSGPGPTVPRRSV